MDGLRLLTEARAAGLTVRANGNQLLIRGPRRAESVAERLLAHKGEVMEALRGNGTPTAQRPGNEEPPLPAIPFADWIRRSDAIGRMGWEAPNLPEWRRWWARSTFDGLAEVGDLLDRADQHRGACEWCGQSKWWRSVHGVVVCRGIL